MGIYWLYCYLAFAVVAFFTTSIVHENKDNTGHPWLDLCENVLCAMFWFLIIAYFVVRMTWFFTFGRWQR